jgi:hypothetical protein
MASFHLWLEVLSYVKALLEAITLGVDVRAFGSVIDREYERVIAGQRDPRFRIIERHRAGGESIYRDPIYERLRSRPDFNTDK